MKIFHITPHYRKLVIWDGNRVTGERYGTFTCTPNTGLTKEQRYTVFRGKLREHGLKAPIFNPTH